MHKSDFRVIFTGIAMIHYKLTLPMKRPTPFECRPSVDQRPIQSELEFVEVL